MYIIVEYVDCFNGKQISVKLMGNGKDQKSSKAMVILIDGYFDIAYNENGESIWPSNNNKGFGTSELGLDPNEFDIYTVGFKKDCSGLLEASREVGKFVSSLNSYNQINLLGISKGGPVFCKALESINSGLMDRINLFTVSSPFEGTVLATPDRLKELAHKKLSIIGDIAYKNIYEKAYTYSPVDSDIGIGTEFIKSLNDAKPLLKKVNFINIITQCDSNTFKEAIKRKDMDAIMQHILNWAIVKGDGIVPLESQEHFSNLAKRVVYLQTPHSWTLADTKIANQIGQVIIETTRKRQFTLDLQSEAKANVVRTPQPRVKMRNFLEQEYEQK